MGHSAYRSPRSWAYTHISPRDEEGEIHMVRRTLHLPVLLGTLAAAVLMACAVALLALSEKAEATFPGKNGRIAYWSNFVIYTITPNGSARTKVTNTSTGGDTALDYSPNGKKIAYTHYDGHDTEIWTSNTNGTGKFQLTNNRTMDLTPSYSPDGKKIVFSGEYRKLFFPWTYAAPEIYTIGVNGKNRVRLTHNSTYDYYPDYSPNGRRIAYAGTGERSLNIYTIRAHGGGKTKVAEGFDSSYSPDGKKIAYSTGKKIYTSNVGGGSKSKVTEGSDLANLVWGSRP